MAIVTAALGCSRSTLGREGGGGAGGSAGAPGPECQLDWEACEPLEQALDFAGGYAFSDVAWTGERVLVVYSDTNSDHLAAVSLGGEVLSQQSFDWPEYSFELSVAFAPWLQAGIMTDSHGVQWLGPTGEPAGSYLATDNVGLGRAGPTDIGFVLLGGFDELYSATVGATPAASMSFQLLNPDGVYDSHRLGFDATSHTRWAASTSWESEGPANFTEIYAIASDGTPSFSQMLPHPPESLQVDLVELAVVDDTLFGLVISQPLPPLVDVQQHLVEVVSERSWRIDGPSSATSYDALLELAGELLVASGMVDPIGRLTLARFDFDAGQLEPAIFQSERPSSSARMTPTSRGFAVVWDGGRGTTLQIFDCCPE